MVRRGALFSLAAHAAAKLSPNLPCKPMNEYMPPAMSKAYDMKKHNGTWYEVSYRDLYPRGPVCDCQQSIKYINEAQGYIDDYFVFTCGPKFNQLNYISPQRENRTNGATGEAHVNGVFDMYVRNSSFKFITHYEWNTEMIGFKDDGKEQYKWVIEYQCGTRPDLPHELCLGQAVDGGCFFTGVQMYVRDLEFLDEGRREMYEYMRGLSPEKTQSAEAAWVMDDFSGGTFPPWFVNVTWRDDCPLPCKSGVYDEETKMWGCPKQNNTRIATPYGFK